MTKISFEHDFDWNEGFQTKMQNPFVGINEYRF